MKKILVWSAAGSLFWTFVLLVNFISETSTSGFKGPVVVRAVAVAFQLTLVACVGVAGLHLFSRLIDFTRFSKYRLPISLSAAAVMSSYTLYRMAALLTGGDWISRKSFALVIQIVLFVVGLSAAATLWFFHELLVRDLEKVPFKRVSRLARAAKRPVFRTGLIASALAIAGGALVFNERNLSNYMFLSIHLIIVTWFLGTTALFRLAAMFPRARKIAVVSAAVWLAMSLAVSIYYRTFDHIGGTGKDRLSSLSAWIAGIRGDDTARFDVSKFNTGLCVDKPKKKYPRKWTLSKGNRKNVILISLEAVRKDTIGMRINGRNVTPNLNAFKNESVYFNHAFATYPATIFSIGSVLTGYMPSEILFAEELPKNLFTITQEQFGSQDIFLPKSAWFHVPIISKLFVQRASTHYDVASLMQVERMIRYLKSQREKGERAFTWAHLFDAHLPYVSRPEFQFGTEPKDNYYSEVAYTDRMLGRLLNYLRRDGWYEDTLVMIFADHGQAIGERNYFGHHVFLTDWLTDVPLFVKAPGLSPKVVESTVSLVDVAPTVTHFLNIPSTNMTGTSLFTKMNNAAKDDFAFAEAFPMRGMQLAQFAETRLTDFAGLKKRIEEIEAGFGNYSPKAAVIQGDWRLIVDRMTDQRELYNSKDDPKNERNLYDEEAQKSRELEQVMREWHKKMSSKIACRLVDSF